MSTPLTVDGLLALLHQRWGVSYDLHLIQRQNRIDLQVMWCYLEQQSFPLDEATYRSRLAQLVETLNHMGKAEEVCHWLAHTRDHPRVGRALSLKLKHERPC